MRQYAPHKEILEVLRKEPIACGFKAVWLGPQYLILALVKNKEFRFHVGQIHQERHGKKHIIPVAIEYQSEKAIETEYRKLFGWKSQRMETILLQIEKGKQKQC